MKETYQGVRGVPEQVAPSAERSRFCGVAKTDRYLTLPRGRFIRRHVAFDSQHQPSHRALPVFRRLISNLATTRRNERCSWVASRRPMGRRTATTSPARSSATSSPERGGGIGRLSMRCSRRPKIASSMFSSSEGSIGSAERASGRPFRIFSSSEALGVRFRTHTEPGLNKVDEH